MKRAFRVSAVILCAAAALWVVAQGVVAPQVRPASLMPEGALVYLEAKDFHALLQDWNTSAARRTWLAGDNYAAFSRSRLFDRLSQARDEFSAVAVIPADADLLGSVAGDQSALALYDIGNLQFVYLTRMSESKAETTPLWMVRDKFELRSEGTAHFYVREDRQSNRTAAFALDKGWLILGTRADLVAGVLDRLEGTETHGLPDQAWYADAVRQAAASPGELRMMLNLEQIVPSPYFRSYWVQRNITEMKQYRAALCDLQRTGKDYRESRVLLRAPDASAHASGDVSSLMTLAPEDAVFASAQASPSPERVLTAMRENMLDLRPQRLAEDTSAPHAATIDTAGSASDLEQRIDVAPVLETESDAYAGIRTLLQSVAPDGLLEVYRTQSSPEKMFVGIERGLVVQAAVPWGEAPVLAALSAAFRRGITASQLGTGWTSRPGSGGNIASLDGSIPLFLAVRGDRLYMATSGDFLTAMLNRSSIPAASHDQGITYEADFDHSAREQQVFGKLAERLDRAGHSAPASDAATPDGMGGGQEPAFFSGNIGSLSRMWSNIVRETVTEEDKGATVIQTVVYRGKQE